MLKNVNDNRECVMCFAKHVKLMRCKRCKRVEYCGRTCQKTHWKNEHKFICESNPWWGIQ